MSGPVVLATITGVLYLVGGAYAKGSSYALGLNLLENNFQPAQYIFTGAEALAPMFASAYWWVGPILGLGIGGFAMAVRRYIPRDYEGGAVLGIAMADLVILAYSAHLIDHIPTLLTRSSCPVAGGMHLFLWAVIVFWCLVLLAGVGFVFFRPRAYRLAALAMGAFASVFCLDCYGRVTGAVALDGTFEIVELGSRAVPSDAASRVLVLGADKDNLVVLLQSAERTRDVVSRPTYLARSKAGTLRVVGRASINEFACDGKR
jgi:hypothetical protein